MKSIQRQIASAYVVSSDGKVLFGRKRPASGAVYEDCWHIPGVGVDAGESLQAGLQREILEETGLDITDYPITLIDDTAHDSHQKTLKTGEVVLAEMQFNIFKVQLNKPAKNIALSESDDLVNLTWFTLDELTTIKMTPPGIEMFNRLGVSWLK